jgi:hypothetical protein
MVSRNVRAKNITAKLSALLPHKTEVTVQPPPTRVFVQGGSSFMLRDEGVTKFDNVVREIVRDPELSAKFTEPEIETKAVQMLLVVAAQENEDARNERVQRLLDELSSYSEQRTIYVPLAGLTVEQPTKLGQVTLRSISEDDVSSATKTTKDKLEQLGFLSETGRQVYLHSFLKDFQSLQGRSCAEFTAVATSARLKERAIDETRRALEVLRFSRPAIYPDTMEIRLGLVWEVFEGVVAFPILDLQTEITGISLARPNKPSGFVLSAEAIERMRDIGAIDLSEILAKEYSSQTDFEQLLLSGLHWLADSDVQAQLENQLLSLITSLETFLTPRDGNPIGTAVAEGVALLIGANLKQRLELKREIKSYYALRSGISHGGRKAVLQSEVTRLRVLAATLLMALIKRRSDFRSQKDLFLWIEERKLT